MNTCLRKTSALRIMLALCAMLISVSLGAAPSFAQVRTSAPIPLPEHPRPDFRRNDWVNLNGQWKLRFDKENEGVAENWFEGKVAFPESATVPFPWGSKLSGVADKGDIAWYRRALRIPTSWEGSRVFVRYYQFNFVDG